MAMKLLKMKREALPCVLCAPSGKGFSARPISTTITILE
jgi:hypothetical protein